MASRQPRLSKLDFFMLCFVSCQLPWVMALSRIDGLQQTIMVFRLLLGVRDMVGVEDIVAGEAIEMLNAFHSLIQTTTVTGPSRIIKEVDLREVLTLIILPFTCELGNFKCQSLQY